MEFTQVEQQVLMLLTVAHQLGEINGLVEASGVHREYREVEGICLEKADSVLAGLGIQCRPLAELIYAGENEQNYPSNDNVQPTNDQQPEPTPEQPEVQA